MKCPYCSKRPNMIKKTIDHDNWWECPVCNRTLGKKQESENKEDKKENSPTTD